MSQELKNWERKLLVAFRAIKCNSVFLTNKEVVDKQTFVSHRKWKNARNFKPV
jgi:hypothetical protein